LENTYGKIFTWFYDLDKPIPQKEALDFYLSYADNDMKILEPMCGSGRFLVPFAERGYQIDGFDLSSEMLQRCKKKVKPIFNNTLIKQCDFLEYKSENLYHYIFIPSGSFSLIIEDEKIISCLKHMRGMLNPKGKIILELMVKDLNEIDKDFKRRRTVKENEIEVVLHVKFHEIDKTKRLFHIIYNMNYLKKGFL
jgi:SAM-dependent methyltransferase